MHLPVRLLTRLGQRLEEILPVHIVQKDVLAPISTAHDMVRCPRILNAQLARHSATLGLPTSLVKENVWYKDPVLFHFSHCKGLIPFLF